MYTTFLIGIPEGKRQFGRHRRGREINIIKSEFKQCRMRGCSVDSTDSGYGPVASSY